MHHKTSGRSAAAASINNDYFKKLSMNCYSTNIMHLLENIFETTTNDLQSLLVLVETTKLKKVEVRTINNEEVNINPEYFLVTVTKAKQYYV
ncbi:unnamed protein product [Amoebophrya sp. A25]|nr:unnamed protein product [Amoebophrya sp. A25]|eukprot:GSA25T00016363001.1